MPDINFPKQIDIPLAELTDGETLLWVNADNQELDAAICLAEGKTEQAKKHQTVARHFRKVLKEGLHAASPEKVVYYNIGVEQSAVNQLIIIARKRNKPALIGKDIEVVKNEEIIARNFEMLEDFSPTDAQKAKCEAKGDEAFGKALQQGKRVQQASIIRGKVILECQDAYRMQNIVNKKIVDEGGGALMLYALMPDDKVEFNPAIANKLFQQNAWIGEASKTTNLSVDVVKGIAAKGTKLRVNKTPDGLFTDLSPYMAKDGAALGAIDPVTAVAVIKLVFGLIKGVAEIVKSFQQVMQERDNKVFSSIKDPSSFEPFAEDFNNNGIDDKEETAAQSLLTLPNIAIGAGVVGLIYAASQNK